MRFSSTVFESNSLYHPGGSCLFTLKLKYQKHNLTVTKGSAPSDNWQSIISMTLVCVKLLRGSRVIQKLIKGFEMRFSKQASFISSFRFFIFINALHFLSTAISKDGRLTTNAFMAEYDQDRFELEIQAKETQPPERETKTKVMVSWRYFMPKLR